MSAIQCISLPWRGEHTPSSRHRGDRGGNTQQSLTDFMWAAIISAFSPLFPFDSFHVILFLSSLVALRSEMQLIARPSNAVHRGVVTPLCANWLEGHDSETGLFSTAASSVYGREGVESFLPEEDAVSVLLSHDGQKGFYDAHFPPRRRKHRIFLQLSGDTLSVKIFSSIDRPISGHADDFLQGLLKAKPGDAAPPPPPLQAMQTAINAQGLDQCSLWASGALLYRGVVIMNIFASSPWVCELSALLVHPSCSLLCGDCSGAALGPNPHGAKTGWNSFKMMVIQLDDFLFFQSNVRDNNAKVYLLCPVCALACYVEGKAPVRNTEQLFVLWWWESQSSHIQGTSGHLIKGLLSLENVSIVIPFHSRW